MLVCLPTLVISHLKFPQNLAHIYPPPNKRFKTPPGADVCIMVVITTFYAVDVSSLGQSACSSRGIDLNTDNKRN